MLALGVCSALMLGTSEAYRVNKCTQKQNQADDRHKQNNPQPPQGSESKVPVQCSPQSFSPYIP